MKPSIENILFLDIETVPQYPTYESAPEKTQHLWNKKAEVISKNTYNAINLSPSDLYEKAGIYAEFGKIVCISAGYVHNEDLRLKSFYGEYEKTLLYDFAELLQIHFNKPENRLCAHNGKEFDFPYIARRLLINGIKLPNILNLTGKKPWENQHIDTMELWKFGDYKHYTSLDLLANIFDIPTPKDTMDGSMVYNVFWEEKDFSKIATYCEKDVKTVYLLYEKITNLTTE